MDVLQKRPAAYNNCSKETLKPPPRDLKETVYKTDSRILVCCLGSLHDNIKGSIGRCPETRDKVCKRKLQLFLQKFSDSGETAWKTLSSIGKVLRIKLFLDLQ